MRCALHSHAASVVQGREMKITVAPNPSHLEMGLPVVQGLVRSLHKHRCSQHCQRYAQTCAHLRTGPYITAMLSNVQALLSLRACRINEVNELRACRNEGTAHALALLLHGDASMAGLGIVTEMMQMSELEVHCANFHSNSA